MNYDDAIQQIIDVLKADKSVVQPWRNKAIARLEEVQAFVRMGKTTSYRHDSDEHPPIQFAGPEPRCVCTPGMPPRRDCPEHRGLAA